MNTIDDKEVWNNIVEWRRRRREREFYVFTIGVIVGLTIAILLIKLVS